MIDTSLPFGERAAFGLLRAGARLTTLAGVALVLPAIALSADKPLSGGAADVRTALGAIGAAIALGGFGGIYLAQSRRPLFANERIRSAPSGGAFDGWLVLLALTLVSVPLATLGAIRPLMTFVADLAQVLSDNGVWRDMARPPDYSGLVAAPIIVVFAVPALLALAVLACGAGAGPLLYLMAMRSVRFPRAFLLHTCVFCACVAASLVGAQLVARVAPDIARAAPDLPGINRYVTLTSLAARALGWAGAVWVAWALTIVTSRRVPGTFTRARDVGVLATDLRAATDAEREHGFAAIARRLDHAD